jgi:hypothetical protein
MRPLFLLMLAVAALVLITACANIANLLLARASMRGPEIATRLALGAGRPRIVRQLLTESILLASAGGILGIGLAAWAGGLGGRLALPLPARIDLTLPTDFRTAVAAVALCFACGILFGLMPASRSTKHGVFDGLRSSASGSSAGLRRVGLRNALAAAQIAMSTALLVCSLLFIRSFSATSASLIGGIDSEGVSVISFNPAMSGYDAAGGRILVERILREAEATPGVLSASITDAIPSFGDDNDFAVERMAEGDRGEEVRKSGLSPSLPDSLRRSVFHSRLAKASGRIRGTKAPSSSTRGWRRNYFRAAHGSDPLCLIAMGQLLGWLASRRTLACPLRPVPAEASD